MCIHLHMVKQTLIVGKLLGFTARFPLSQPHNLDQEHEHLPIMGMGLWKPSLPDALHGSTNTGQCTRQQQRNTAVVAANRNLCACCIMWGGW